MRRLRSIIWPFWPYDRFLCSQSLSGFVRNQEKVSQAYKMSVSKKRLHTKRTTLHFFVRNGERSPLLLETNNTLRVVTQTYFNSEHTIDFGQHDSGFGRLDCKPLWAPRSTVVSHLRLETWWNQSCPKGHSFKKCTNVSWVNSKLLALVYRKYNKPTAWERKPIKHMSWDYLETTI